jgi:uncharacterized protein (TIGR02757 family)
VNSKKSKSTVSIREQCFCELPLNQKLEELYSQLNKSEFIHPDPLEFIFHYKENRDREIIGLIAASLAYGRVAQILKSVEKITSVLTPSPAEFILHTSKKKLEESFSDFKHRFTTGEEVVSFLWKIRTILKKYQSLEQCFNSHYSERDTNVQRALSGFANELRTTSGPNSLIPSPDRGSGCKRLHLFLRWMVRKDDVDPGCWKSIGASKLIIPLDTHMFNIGRILGLTASNGQNIKTALEITEKFKELRPDDPVRYDFALTRLGIRSELTVDHLTSPRLS